MVKRRFSYLWKAEDSSDCLRDVQNLPSIGIDHKEETVVRHWTQDLDGVNSIEVFEHL